MQEEVIIISQRESTRYDVLRRVIDETDQLGRCCRIYWIVKSGI